MAQQDPTIVRGGHIVTSASSDPNAVVEDGALLVEDARITEIADFERLRERHPDAAVIGSRDHVVMPGLVNSHHHGLGLTSFQLGALDDALEAWMINLHAALQRVRDVHLDTLYADAQLLRSGVTSVAHLGYARRPELHPDEIRDTLRAHETSGIRARYAVNFRDRFRFVYEDDDAFLSRLPADARATVEGMTPGDLEPSTEDLLGVYDEVRGSADARVGVMLAAEGPEWCTDELLSLLRARATDDGVPLHVHVLESPIQRDVTRELFGASTIEHLAELDFLQADTSLAHAIWLSRSDIELCAERGASVCHNPSSNLRLCNGIAPVTTMRTAGVNVALGSDSTSFGDRDDFLAELRMARLLHRLPPADAGLDDLPGLSARDAFEMATTCGARTIGLDGEIGELSAGRHADVVLLRRDAIEGAYLHPDTDMRDAIVYRADADCVDLVMVDGRLVVEGGRCLHVDEEAVAAELRAHAEAADPDVAAWAEVAAALRPHVRAAYARWRLRAQQPAYLANDLS